MSTLLDPLAVPRNASGKNLRGPGGAPGPSSLTLCPELWGPPASLWLCLQLRLLRGTRKTLLCCQRLAEPQGRAHTTLFRAQTSRAGRESQRAEQQPLHTAHASKQALQAPEGGACAPPRCVPLVGKQEAPVWAPPSLPGARGRARDTRALALQAHSRGQQAQGPGHLRG